MMSSPNPLSSAFWLRTNDNIALNGATDNKFHISGAGAQISTTANAFEMQIDAPEPASLVSALIGAGLAIGYGWRKRRQVNSEPEA